MARPGIHYEDVKTAARTLLERGFNPSIQRVRQLLGTGSNSTIAEYLKQWQQEMTATPQTALPPSIPESVMGALESFWRVALEQAEALYQERREQAENAVSEAERQRDAALQETHRCREEAAECRQKLTQTQALLRESQEQGLLEKERRRVAEASIASEQVRVRETIKLLEQERQETESHIAGLDQILCQTQEDNRLQLAQAERRLQEERQRGEASETRWLRIIDQNRTEYAAERAHFNSERTTWQKREAVLQSQLEGLRQETAKLRMHLAGVEERGRGLETSCEELKKTLNESEQRYRQAVRLMKSLRGKLKTVSKPMK